ncbi:hypothetical protein IWZ03DRAFT_414576 [Phyllosticta citriasiana]|uniref:PEHE domain-containing protein n=1 Tax=Phyllosticta citriasiana TaxID=595635 RepID=A0ABR1KP48_9PEZI
MSSSPSTPPKVDGKPPVHDHTPKNPSPLRHVMSVDSPPPGPKIQLAPPLKLKLKLNPPKKETGSNGSKVGSEASVFDGPSAAEDTAGDDGEAALRTIGLPRVLQYGSEMSGEPAGHSDAPAKASSTAFHFTLPPPPPDTDNNNNVNNSSHPPFTPASLTHAPRTVRVILRERSRRNAKCEDTAKPPRTPTLAPVRPVIGRTPILPVDDLPRIFDDDEQSTAASEQGSDDDGHAQHPQPHTGADEHETYEAWMERRRERRRERASRRAKDREARERLERYERAYQEREQATQQSVMRWLGVPEGETSKNGENDQKQQQVAGVSQDTSARSSLTLFPPPIFTPPDRPLLALPAGATQPEDSSMESHSKDHVVGQVEAGDGTGDAKTSSKQE